jgi:hypothetical protein
MQTGSGPTDNEIATAGLARTSAELDWVRRGPMAGALPMDLQLKLAYQQVRQRAITREQWKMQRRAKIRKRARRRRPRVLIKDLQLPTMDEVIANLCSLDASVPRYAFENPFPFGKGLMRPW